MRARIIVRPNAEPKERTLPKDTESPLIGTAEQDGFIRGHLYSVVMTLRRDGSPSNSVIFTVADGD